MKDSYLDELTGCYNRRFLYYWINNEVKRATRFSTKFAIILLDIDDFRHINNNFGHLEGDRTLVEFSNTLDANIREVDSIVRYGGDEFIILMPNTNEKGAADLAQRIIDFMNASEIAGHKILCSMGYAVFPDDGSTPELLINQADSLMYQAKKHGKNRIGWRHAAIRMLQIPSPITVGRDDEVKWCVDQLKTYNTIFVAGEAGIGKTRLVLDIKDRLKAPIILRGNAYAALTSVPYHPFKNMLSELIKQNFSMVQRIFKQLPTVSQSEIMKLFPAESALKVGHTEGLDKYRLYNSVSEYLVKVSDTFAPENTIILIDDLHWLDKPSCELLDFILRSATKFMKVFGTYRIEEIKKSPIADFLGIWSREKLHTQISVAPLNETQTGHMLKAIIGSVPHAGAKYVYQQSGGVPFYIEEILRELERERKLYWNGKDWTFAKKIEVSIPRSISETIKRKLKFLDAEIKQYLELAAVYGQEFSTEVIAMASKRNVGQILDAIDELCDLGFLKERGSNNYFFSEDIVRQIVYQNISRNALLLYHKAVGETIEVIYRNILPNYFEQLAVHFTKAHDIHKTLYYSKCAAQKAKENYAHSTAVKFFENYLKYEDNPDEIFNIKFDLADIFLLVGKYDKAIEHLNSCLKINPNSYKVYEKLGKAAENMGDYKNSLEYYQTGLDLTQGTDAIHTFKSAIAWLHTRLGEYARAQEECEKMLKKKSQISRQVLGDSYLILGVVFTRLGKFKKAEEYIRKSLKIRKTTGDKRRIAACYLDLGLNYHEKYNIKMSQKFYNRSLKLYEEIGHQQGILITYNNIGALYADRDLPKAEQYYLKALKQAKLIGAKRTIVYLHFNLGAIEFNRMMYDQTLLHYKESLSLSKEMNFHEGIIFSNIGLSDFYREKGKLAKGRRYLDRAVKAAKRINMKYLNIDCLLEEINYLLLDRQLKKADALSKDMVSRLRLERNVAYKVNSLIYRGKILAERKQYAKAHDYYKKGISYLKSFPSNRLSGEIYYLRGIAYKKQGKKKEALKMFLESSRIFSTSGNLRFIDKIEKEIAETKI